MKITGAKKKFDIDVKRFYCYDSITAKCPDCGATTEANEYISYPTANTYVDVEFHCECDVEWEERAYLAVELRKSK